MKTVLTNQKKGSHPEIELKVQRVESSVWENLGFHKHHYLTAKMNAGCKCLLFTWNNQPIAFVGFLNTPRKGRPYGMSVSRIVIMPDYQNLGLFKPIMNFCGGIIKSQSDESHEYELYIKTAHSKAKISLDRNPLWEGTVFDGKVRKEKSEKSGKYKNHLLRLSCCKKYVGDIIDGYQELLLPVKDLRDKKGEE